MLKRIVVLIISLASLAGLVYYWPNVKPSDGQVKGRITDSRSVGQLTTAWERPFISDRTGQRKIYFFDSTRPETVSMIPGDQAQLLPAEIANGQWLYFTQEADFYKLWRYSADTKVNQFILALRRQPASLQVTRDGRLAAYTLPDNESDVPGQRTFLVTIDTGKVKEIIAGARSMIFSPDSRRIVYATNKGLFISELSRDLIIGEPLAIETGNIYTPIYGASGEDVYYIQKNDDSYILKRAELRTGTNQDIVLLAQNSSYADWSIELSPDGKKIIYWASIDRNFIQTIIGRVAVDGSGLKLISQDGGEAHWSKSGQTILFNTVNFTAQGPRLQIWRMDEDGNNREAVAQEGNNWIGQIPWPLQ